MTPFALQELCAQIPSPGPFPPTINPLGLRAALEVACDEQPTSLALRTLLLHAQQLNQLHNERPERVAGVRLEQLIRWDHFTSTWLGTEMATGRAHQVRLMNRSTQNEPVLKRCLIRDHQILTTLFSDARLVDESSIAIILPLSGSPFCESPEPLSESLAIQLVGAGLSALERWACCDVVPPELTPMELRDEGQGLSIQCLSPLENDELTTSLTSFLASYARAALPQS